MVEASRAKSEGYAAFAEGCWTFDDVEQRLIEAWGFLRRMPGGGASPFAKDGPWTQIRLEWGDYVDRDELREREARPRGALRTSEVDRMNEALEWVATYANPRDVRLVGLAIGAMEREGSQVQWAALAPHAKLTNRLGHPLRADALRMRYARAITAIAAGLNLAENPRSTLSMG